MMTGDDFLERRFHAKFLDLHMRREWFKASPEIFEVVAQINNGTFDTDSLPEPIALPRNRRSFSEIEKRKVSYRARIRNVQIKTGYKCRFSVDNFGDQWTADKAVAIDLFLANPQAHGTLISESWAVALRDTANRGVKAQSVHADLTTQTGVQHHGA